MDIEHRTTLPLASSGCSCCSPGGTHQAPAAVVLPSPSRPVREFAVEGLTCGHCVSTVEKAVAALDGIESAAVELVPGGRSRLTVAGGASDAAVRTAVTAAGYSLAAH